MTSLRSARINDLLRMSLTNLDPLTENYDLGFYSHYLAKWPSLFIIAEDTRGDIIGYIMGKVEESPDILRYTPQYLPWHGHITALTVAPQYRRLGLAKRLTEALERACEAQNAWFVDLFVRVSNEAIDLYRGMGYSVYRKVKDYYNDDPKNPGCCEDGFDMRKPMSRDKKREHVRENGENYTVNPEDIYG